MIDDEDNCVDAPNPDQADQDSDGLGNVCDSDRDGDGDANSADNCVSTPNANQSDLDRDGIGDACDLQTYPPTKDDCKNNGWKLLTCSRTRATA